MRKLQRSFITITVLTAVLGVSLAVAAPAAFAQDNTPQLPNPLGTNKDGKPISLIDVMLRVMQIALAAVDIFALFMFILGGFEFLISAGNPNLIKKAKDTLVWATLGILVITLSYSILKFLFEAVRKKLGT